MTQDEIMEMARQAGLFTHREVQPEIVAFANLVTEKEREACAKAVEDAMWFTRYGVAKAIRARGQA